MSNDNGLVVSFLEELMLKRKRLPSQLALDLGVSHPTVHRWLKGKDEPNIKSCYKLAEYSGISLQKVLAIAEHMPSIEEGKHTEWPEFRDYARLKYSRELDEDLITMIEDLIERRRHRNHKNSKGS